MSVHAPVLPRLNGSSDSICVLRWIFQKGGRSITCLLQRSGGDSTYDVCVVPHWDVASAVVEGTATPVRAFCRHAEIARRLRAAGWSVVERSH
jgi:hypothetical protein